MSSFTDEATTNESSSSSAAPIGDEFLASRMDKSDQFNQIMNERLLPMITRMFSDFSAKDFLEPTRHLDNKFKEQFGESDEVPEYEKKTEGGIEVLGSDFNSYYKIADIGEDYMVIIKLNQNCFSLSIVPDDDYEHNTSETNYIAFSPERKKSMYIYGVKANGEGPKISGNTFNKAALDICREMHIPQLFISDSAGIPCYWNENIELKHFSVLRVMVGKPTFYESMAGHFLNPEAAAKEKEAIYAAITEEERTIIKEYLNSLKNPKDPSKSGICDQINEIINKVAKDESGNNKKLEIYDYVATPYQATEGGKRRRRTKRRGTKKRRSTKRRGTKRRRSTRL